MPTRPQVPDLPSAGPLRPQARPLDTYQTPTRVNVVGAPKSNALIELGKSLSSIEPHLAKYTADREQRISDDEMANAEADYYTNNESIKKMIAENNWPASVSPYYIRAASRAALRDSASEYRAYLNSSWAENGEVLNSDDPLVMRRFIDAARETHQADGRYASHTDLDMKEVLYPLMLAAESALQNHHQAYRLQEHERIGEQRAANAVMTALDDYLTPGASLDDIGRHINGMFYNPKDGLVTMGMSGSKANKLIVDAVMGHAEETGDPDTIGVLNHITTGGGVVGKTSYARDKEQFTRERMAVKREREDRWSQKNIRDETKARSDQQKIRILVGAAKGGSAGLKEIDEAMVLLRHLDPDAAMTMETYLHKKSQHDVEFTETPASRTTAARLRLAMSDNPGEFSSDLIIQAMNSGRLNPDKVQPLVDDWERLRVNVDHPLLRQPVFTQTLDLISKGVGSNPDDEYGAGAIKSADVRLQLRTMAQGWITDHPKGTATEFNEFILRSARPLVMEHNKELQNQAERDRKKAEDAGAAVVRSQNVPSQSVTPQPQPPPSAKKIEGNEPLSPKELTYLMNPKDHRELLSAASSGMADDDLRYLITQKFEPIYRAYGRPRDELYRAVDKTLELLTKKKSLRAAEKTP